MVLPVILKTAVVAGLVVGVIAWIAVWFNTKSASGFPNKYIWLIGFVVWILLVFFGGNLAFA